MRSSTQGTAASGYLDVAYMFLDLAPAPPRTVAIAGRLITIELTKPESRGAYRQRGRACLIQLPSSSVNLCELVKYCSFMHVDDQSGERKTPVPIKPTRKSRLVHATDFCAIGSARQYARSLSVTCHSRDDKLYRPARSCAIVIPVDASLGRMSLMAPVWT